MTTTLVITKDGKTFTVDNPKAPGSPAVGRGPTMVSAIGAWFVAHQQELGYDFDVTEVQGTEDRRRQRELAKR